MWCNFSTTHFSSCLTLCWTRSCLPIIALHCIETRSDLWCSWSFKSNRFSTNLTVSNALHFHHGGHCLYRHCSAVTGSALVQWIAMGLLTASGLPNVDIYCPWNWPVLSDIASYLAVSWVHELTVFMMRCHFIHIRTYCKCGTLHCHHVVFLSCLVSSSCLQQFYMCIYVYARHPLWNWKGDFPIPFDDKQLVDLIR